MTEKQKYSFKCMEQTCTGRVCCIRQPVIVTVGDLTRWTTQGYIEHILGVITVTDDESGGQVLLTTARKPLNKEPEKTSCVFFNEGSNGCTIRFSRPISCRTFPLIYDGEKFRVSDNSCPGIGRGEVTAEAL